MVDVGEPAAPQEAAWFAVGDRCEDLCLRGDELCLGAGAGGMLLLRPTISVTATPDEAPAAAGGLACFPNPFNPATRIAFTLARSGRARLAVFAVDGRRLASLLDAELPAGSHAVDWRGRDEAGRELPSGLYLARLEAGGAVRVTKMLLAR